MKAKSISAARVAAPAAITYGAAWALGLGAPMRIAASAGVLMLTIMHRRRQADPESPRVKPEDQQSPVPDVPAARRDPLLPLPTRPKGSAPTGPTFNLGGQR